MREIKFRAWDTEKKEMANVNNIDLCDYELTLQDNECGIWKSAGYYTSCIMQYTGFNPGTEVYEGDILKIQNSQGEEAVVQVYWDEKSYMYRVKGSGHWSFIGEGLSLNSIVMNPTTEVIGNIYENPELLNN